MRLVLAARPGSWRLAVNSLKNSAPRRESIWIPFMENDLAIDPSTVVVGHSSGAIAAMRFAQKHKVAGIVLVATYETTLGLGGERRSEYFNTPWDWAAIKQNAGFVIQVGGQRRCARGPCC